MTLAKEGEVDVAAAAEEVLETVIIDGDEVVDDGKLPPSLKSQAGIKLNITS